MTELCELMSKIQYYQASDQVKEINQVLRGHYAYYGLGGYHKSLWRIYRFS
jgi:hypothetical protein